MCASINPIEAFTHFSSFFWSQYHKKTKRYQQICLKLEANSVNLFNVFVASLCTFFVVHVHHQMWVKSNIQWLHLMGNSRGKGMNWGGGRVEQTESRHENIMKKSEKSITSFQTGIRRKLGKSNWIQYSFLIFSRRFSVHFRYESLHDGQVVRPENYPLKVRSINWQGWLNMCGWQ